MLIFFSESSKRRREGEPVTLPTSAGIHLFKQKKVRKLNSASETAKSFRDNMLNRHNRVSAETQKKNLEKMNFANKNKMKAYRKF